MSELYSTGVPLPFECVFAGKVKNVKVVEASLHQAFSPNRVNPSREFFDIDEEQAIVILKLLDHEDVTPEINQELDRYLCGRGYFIRSGLFVRTYRK